ncbi:hypothetical protein K431DRAFT_340598 [Polychaeton citri CBS 116435]|uniref:Zn(2)-C6 fungal-type domain-containing protein n=1 Tax=Polychaeton citri CBS 116435 TaxID=1314669 RepID=A0A9P4UMR7_9PEZI|nr:hypothetical protein K431DRAFT_340598 [Polychaeton citri CBS 116435]
MADAGTVQSPAAALREQFGDRKPPDITRKITACVACRKQKIRCHMVNGEPPCTRCQKRGLPCNVNKSLQMILESDVEWKHAIEQRLERLETAMAGANGAGDADGDAEHSATNESPLSPAVVLDPLQQSQPTPRSPPSNESQNMHHWEIVMDPNSGPGGIPGSYLHKASTQFEDLLFRNVVSLQQAEEYLDIYQNRLDHFLYRILPERRQLTQIRSERLLFAAICAVGALHMASPVFEDCYQEFVSLAGQQCFARQSSLDDIRALCIGSFWLSGISWKCVGTAVQIATEMQLHRSVFKALEGDRQHYLRTRLYYLLYVADHQHSIPYGRPPMTRDDESIRTSLRFLQSKHALAVEDDARLVSQVHFWLLGSDVYSNLGIDLDQPLNAAKLAQLRRLSIRLDGIRADWTEAFNHNRFVGNYPKKGVGLHHHFSKLYLNSHAFRGVGKPGFKSADVAMDIDELANAAMLSATTILRTVTTDSEIQGYLNGLPTYFDVMIAFAVVFVLKVSTTYASSVSVSISEVRTLVADLVKVLKRVTHNMHSRHILASVAHGAETLLSKCWPEDMAMLTSGNDFTLGFNQSTFDQSLYDMSQNWANSSSDNFFMADFDFLSH